MAIKLTIKNDKLAASISISINVAAAEQPVDFKNAAMQKVQNMDEPIASTQPFVTYKAIEGACLSGIIYARRKLGVKGLFVELLSFFCDGKVENAEPFAVATMIATCKSFPEKKITFSEKEMCGWTVSDE